WEVLRLAVWTIAPPPGVGCNRRRAAVGAETMARVPGEHRLGFGQCRDVFGGYQPLNRDRAQIDDEEAWLALEQFRRRRIDRGPIARDAALQAEKHGFADRGERARFRQTEQRVRLARLAQDKEFAADQISAGLCIECGERAVITAVAGAVERVCDITEKRPRSEVEHAVTPGGRKLARQPWRRNGGLKPDPVPNRVEKMCEL